MMVKIDVIFMSFSKFYTCFALENMKKILTIFFNVFYTWYKSLLKRLFNFGIEIVAANDYKMPIEIFGKIWLSTIKVKAKGVMV